MKQEAENLNALSETVIGAAIEVHRNLGPGFFESVYETALSKELTLRGVPFASQVGVQISYKGELVGEARLDLVIDRKLIIELKAVDMLTTLH